MRRFFFFFSLAYKMQYHTFEKDMMLTGTQCVARTWRAYNAYRFCLNGTSKWLAYLAIFSLYMAYLLPLLCLGASKCIRLRHLKLCIFFLNILVCCTQQRIIRWRQNGQGGIPVKKSRAECFRVRHPLRTQWT